MDKASMQYDVARKRIFDLLKEQEITQKEFAEKLHIPAQTITDWKKGKSNSFAGQYGKIAPILHTTASWLAFGEGIKYVPDEFREEILQQEREKSRASHIRTDLRLAIDRIPDSSLNGLTVHLFEMLMQISYEDMDLLEGIMRVIIAKRERISKVREDAAPDNRA